MRATKPFDTIPFHVVSTVYLVEYPEGRRFPDVIADRGRAHTRFMEIFEDEHGRDLIDQWGQQDYMSFEDEGGGMYCLVAIEVE